MATTNSIRAYAATFLALAILSMIATLALAANAKIAAPHETWIERVYNGHSRDEKTHRLPRTLEKLRGTAAGT